MKNKISIIVLVIILMMSVYVFKDKENSIEYKKIQNELRISQDENKQLTKKLEIADNNLNKLKTDFINNKSIIKLKDREIMDLNNNIKNMHNYLKVYKNRSIYSDYVEEKRSALNIINFSEYEKQIFSTENIEDLFELYGQNLDGAISEGYCGKLYDYYTSIEKIEFIEKLEPYSIYKINGIVDCLVTEMSLIYYNDGVIDMKANTKSMLDILENNELSYKEKYIIYKIVAVIEEMVNY